MKWLRFASRPGRSAYVWALVTQGAVSATNLGLSLLAGRALGPEGLGSILAGFMGYAALTALARAFFSTPLVSRTAALPLAERAGATAAATTCTAALGLVGTGTFLAVGLTLDGPIARGLLLFAPWMATALTQDLFRAVLFRDARPRVTAVSDGAWLAVMVAGSPLVLAIREDWAIVGLWGAGSVVALLITARVLRPARTTPGSALSWARDEASRLGRWLVAQEVLFTATGYLLIVVMTRFAGARGLGGLRAAETIFAPFSLIAPALTLPGLPAVSRAVARSRGAGLRVSATLSGVAVLATGAYFAVMAVVGERILTLVYGDDFREFSSLVWPIGVWQLATALGLGFTILLKAQGRGRALTVGVVVNATASLLLVSLLAASSGIEGAAWGFAVAAWLGAVTTTVLAVAGPGRAPTRAPVTVQGAS